MSDGYLGRSVPPNEDPKLLTGRALFVDDVHLENMLHCTILRSDFAHGRIQGIDVSEALARPGIVAVYTADDLGDYWCPGPVLVPPPPIEGLTFNAATIVPLARDKVRFVGEPLAVVVAESRFSEGTLAELERRGHRVRRSGPWEHGRVLAVACDPETGLCEAAASPRSRVAYAIALP